MGHSTTLNIVETPEQTQHNPPLAIRSTQRTEDPFQGRLQSKLYASLLHLSSAPQPAPVMWQVVQHLQHQHKHMLLHAVLPRQCGSHIRPGLRLCCIPLHAAPGLRVAALLHNVLLLQLCQAAAELYGGVRHAAVGDWLPFCYVVLQVNMQAPPSQPAELKPQPAEQQHSLRFCPWSTWLQKVYNWKVQTKHRAKWTLLRCFAQCLGCRAEQTRYAAGKPLATSMQCTLASGNTHNAAEHYATPTHQYAGSQGARAAPNFHDGQGLVGCAVQCVAPALHQVVGQGPAVPGSKHLNWGEPVNLNDTGWQAAKPRWDVLGVSAWLAVWRLGQHACVDVRALFTHTFKPIGVFVAWYMCC